MAFFLGKWKLNCSIGYNELVIKTEFHQIHPKDKLLRWWKCAHTLSALPRLNIVRSINHENPVSWKEFFRRWKLHFLIGYIRLFLKTEFHRNPQCGLIFTFDECAHARYPHNFDHSWVEQLQKCSFLVFIFRSMEIVLFYSSHFTRSIERMPPKSTLVRYLFV